MAAGTYNVVVTFDRNEEGDLVPSKGQQMPSAEAAERHANAFGKAHAGAVAFSCTGDPATGEFGEVEVIASVGEVALETLVGGE